MRWDALCRFILFPYDRSPRTGPIIPSAETRFLYRCPVILNGETGNMHDAGFDLSGLSEPLDVNEHYTVKVVFVDEEVSKKLFPGLKFKMWEGGIIGEGVIEKLLESVP